MTKKLFFDDVYLKTFHADIVEFKEVNNEFHIVLDQTAFYPEGGGQPCDTGVIDEMQVIYVYEDDGKIYHVLNQKPNTLHHITCNIDWTRRFDHMQQHLGQHILSACFYDLFQAETVGFHLSAEYVTIDITLKDLSSTEADKVEFLANQIVLHNLAVKQLFPNDDELQKLPLRKAPKVNENIRIIAINDFDYSPCGGTHPTYTGEVGLIKIRKWEKVRDSIRIEFICGNRSLKDYNWKNHYIHKIASLLSIKDTDALKGVERIFADYNAQKKELRRLKAQNLDYEALALYQQAPTFQGIKIIHQVYEDRDFGELRLLASKTVSQPSAIVLMGVKNQKAQMLFSRSENVDINMHMLFKEVSPMIDGKGGGNPHTAQGGGSALSNLEGALNAAQTIIIKRYLSLK
ncbi:DHHA1 domain-containing protein [Clostridiaceae bacterium 35-E11]